MVEPGDKVHVLIVALFSHNDGVASSKLPSIAIDTLVFKNMSDIESHKKEILDRDSTAQFQVTTTLVM